MKDRLNFLIKVSGIFLVFFILLKPVFMLSHLNLYVQTPISEWFNIIYNGLSMDVAVTSYIIAPIILFLIISIWLNGKWFKYINVIYLSLMSIIVSIIIITDLFLYSYWGFRIKLNKIWENTLIVFIADHGVSYLLDYNERGKESHSIPMIWCGGAIKEPMKIDNYASQSDMVSTLLAQLGIDYSNFKYSRNIADSTLTNFAYWTFANGFAMADSSNFVIYDIDAGSAPTLEGDESQTHLHQGKAILQKLYDRIK